MSEYVISLSGTRLGAATAESATEALDLYCHEHADDDTGFARGGLHVDSDTRGRLWASIRTDGGRICAERVDTLAGAPRGALDSEIDD